MTESIWKHVMNEARTAHVIAWHRAHASLADYNRMTGQNIVAKEES